MIDWIFPETGYGTEYGKNDPGIETFRGDPYPSLAREPIQNSLDAKREELVEPVIVKFETIKISEDKFPGKSNLIKILELCKKESIGNEETIKEYDKAIKTLKAEEIVFLKISDFNTTGLSGSDQLRKTNWHRLIKTVGDSNKASTSGGSFGIGKHAPFACSDLRTVFYSTLDTEGKAAFQGVAKLITHTDEEGRPRQGTGFFGEVEYLQPIKELEKINSIFHRDKIGTDVFIAGFNDNEEWENEIIKSIIESFFVAIHESKLEVVVGGKHLKADNIDVFIDDYIKEDADYDADRYFNSLISSESKVFSEKNFEGLGEIRLHLLSGNDLHKKIAMVRDTGMLIRAKQNYSTPIKYAGVLLVKGKEFNKLLKKIENPSHTDWEVKRHPDPKLAKRVINKLYRWMNEKIKELSPINDTEEFNVEELGQFLPDDIDGVELLNENRELEGEKGRPLEIKMEKTKKKRRPEEELIAGFEEVAPTTEPEINEEDTFIVSEGGSDTDQDGEGRFRQKRNPDGGSNSNRNPNSNRSRLPEVGSDIENGQNNEANGTQRNKKKKVRIIKRRVFCINPEQGIYQVRMDSQNSGTAYLKISVSGEEDNEPTEVENALKLDSDEWINVEENTVGPFTIDEGKNLLQFKLKQSLRVRLEVSIYEG